MKIYTRKGDKGETGIINKRLSKSSNTIELIGTLDELNASLGIVAFYTKHSKDKVIQGYKSRIQSMQEAIFSIGAIVAQGKSDLDFELLTLELEKSIDLMEENLESLQNFILPGGSELSSHAHVARSICRKAERSFVKHTRGDRTLPDLQLNNAGKYLNRLSDWLFMYARFANQQLGVKDVLWKN